MSKLTRAEIPMCPNRECGPVEISWDANYKTGRCPQCGEYFGSAYECDPLWGYYAPDVARVVAKLRDISYGEDDRLSVYLTAKEARAMADALEGKS